MYKRIALSVLFLIGSGADATVFYTSEAQFRSDVAIGQTVTFNDLPQGTSFFPDPLTVDGLTFSVAKEGGAAIPGLGNNVSGDELNVDYTIDGSKFLAVDLSVGSTLSVNFLNPQDAFGLTFQGLANGSRMETINLLGMGGTILDSFIYASRPNTLDSSSLIYFGAKSSSPIYGFTVNYTPLGGVGPNGLTPINDFFGIDNILLTSGLTSAVPEPSTWAMMLFGFGAIGWSMRRSRRVKALLS